MAWLPILTIENSNQQRQTAAGIDKVSNQITRQRAEFIGALPGEARDRLIQNNLSLLDETANGSAAK